MVKLSKILIALFLVSVIFYFGLNFLKSNTNGVSPDDNNLQINNKASVGGYSFMYPGQFTQVNKDNFEFYAENGIYFITADFIKDYSSYNKWLLDIKSELKTKSPQVSSAVVQGKEVLFESRMSAEGTFERNVFVETNNGLIRITVNGTAENTNQNEETIISVVEDIATDVANSLEFN